MTTLSKRQHEIDVEILAALNDGKTAGWIVQNVSGCTEKDIREVAADHSIEVRYDADRFDEPQVDPDVFEKSKADANRKHAIENRESVNELLADFGNDPNRFLWVAQAYGECDDESERWKGIFFLPSGNPNIELIEQEAAEPGSVIADDFKTPNQQRLQKQMAAEAEAQAERAAEVEAGRAEAESEAKKLENRRPVEVANAVRKELQAGQNIVGTIVDTTPGATAEVVRKQAEKLGVQVYRNVAELEAAEYPTAEERKPVHFPYS